MFRSSMLLAALVLACVALPALAASVYPPYPRPSLPGTVYLVNLDNRPQDDVLLIQSLQGALAKVFVDSSAGAATLLYHVSGTPDANPDYSYWSDYQDQFGDRVKFDSTTLVSASVGTIVKQFATVVRGWYLVAPHTDSVNVGVSMAGITPAAVLGTPAHIALFQALSLPMLDNLTLWTEDQFVADALSANPWPFSDRFVMSQLVDKALVALTDWTILLGAIQVQTNTNYLKVLAKLRSLHQPTQFLTSFGWVPINSSEHDYTAAASAAGGGVLASDWLYNAATHIYFAKGFGPITNPSKADPSHLPNNRGKHTATFLFTDGDNICSDLNLLLDKQHFNSPKDGEGVMGWGLNPTLASIAPIGLQAYYKRAKAKDSFIAFSSTYAYPDTMPDDRAVMQWAQISGQAMALADMRVLNYIGNDFNTSHFAPMLEQFNIDGAFYWYYYNNYVNGPDGPPGQVKWYGGKPVISNRASFWVTHSNATSIAQLLNGQKRDHTTTDGYSVVAVHIWSEGVQDVLDAIALLDDGVLVVKPDELIQLMTKNVKPENKVEAF